MRPLRHALYRLAAAALAGSGAMLIAAGTAAQEEETKADGVRDLVRDVKLSLGPVRWRAVLVDEYRLQKATDAQRSSGFVSSGGFNAASYVFQPWFAQVSGGIGFVYSSVEGAGQDKSKSASLTGEGSLNLFPASRFPFDTWFSVSDSRASGEITDSDYRNTRFGLRQSYRSLGGSQYTARYERSTISGNNFGNDVLDVLEGTYSKRFDKHAVELSGNHSSNTGGVNGTQTDLTRVNGRHTFEPAANMKLETLASYNQNDFAQTTSSLRNVFSNRYAQLASFGSWRPREGDPLFDEDHPLDITGGLRYSGIASDNGSTTVGGQTASGSLGLNYTIGPVTRLSAVANVTQAAVAGGASGDGLATSQSLTVSHAPLPVPLGGFLYSWNTTGGASNSTGGSFDTNRALGATAAARSGSSWRQGLFGQAGHNLMRNLEIGSGSNVALSLGQSAGANYTAGITTQNLTNSATASWSLLGESTAQTFVSLSASDSRTYGEISGSFQLLNLQATRQAPTGPRSFWTANLTVQGARQNLESNAFGLASRTSNGFNVTTTGSVAYQHTRFLDVPRLRLFASYTANQAQQQSRALGDLDAPRSAVIGAIDARLDYQVGKVDARLSFRTANVDNRRNSLLYLRVTRNF